MLTNECVEWQVCYLAGANLVILCSHLLSHRLINSTRIRLVPHIFKSINLGTFELSYRFKILHGDSCSS